MTRVEAAPTEPAAGARLAPRPGEPAARRALVALAAVAALYVLTQLVVFTLSRPLTWDEVVYLAQSAPGEVGMDWGPQRARGIVWLVAPVAMLHAATEVVRAYLVVLSGLGLFLAFRPWLRVLGPVAAAAAFVFGCSWIGLYFGMEVFPNLPAALATVAAGGYLTDAARTGRRRALIGTAVSVALIALFRPPDSVWLAVAMYPAAALVACLPSRLAPDAGDAAAESARQRVRRVVSLGAALGVGGVVGWAPWLIEMGVRYGGPLQAIAAAKAESASGRPRNDLDQYLNIVEGPVRLIVRDPTLTYRALAALLMIGALILVAVLHRRRRGAAVVAVAGMAGGLVPYIVLHTGVNLRYLLPAWGLASVAVAIGAAAAVRAVTSLLGPGEQPAPRSPRVTPATAAGLVLTLLLGGVWIAGNARIADSNADVAVLGQTGMYLVAAEAALHAGDGPCAFVSEYGYPQIAWATDCIGLEMDVYGETGQCPLGSHSLARLAQRGYTVFALARSRLPDALMVSRWDSQRLKVRGHGPWRLYEPGAAQLARGAVPRLPAEGEASVPCPVSRAPAPHEIAPLRIGPRLPGDETLKFLQRRQGLAEEIK